MKWRNWAHGLFGGIIGGVSSAGSVWIATLIAEQIGIQGAALNWKQFGTVLLINGIGSAFLYLKQSPLPPLDGEDNSTPTSPAVPLVILAALVACGGSGCSSPSVTKAFVRTSVSTGVAFGTLKEPAAIPFLRAAAPVVCSAANGTNVSPAEVVAALESSDATALKTPGGVILLNAALSLYMTLYEEFGKDVDNLPQLQAWLAGTCEGILLGLPPAGPAATVVTPESPVAKPHIK